MEKLQNFEDILRIKEEILNVILERKKEYLRKSKESLRKTVQGAAEAPHSMQTRSDTSREELSRLAGSLQSRTFKLEEELRVLKAYKFGGQRFDVVETGALVECVTEENDKLRYYIFLPVGAGESLSCTGLQADVMVLTPHSPLFQAMFGKTEGEKVKSNNLSLTIKCIS